jgi:SAM-dependent methyltransferase
MLAGDVAALALEPGTILDLACGDGYLLQIFARRFPEARLIGIDMSPEELASARERLHARAELQLANARALPLEDNMCDAVTCHLAFMLMDDAPAVLTEVARVLRPAGIFAGIINGGRTADPVLIAFMRALWDVEKSEKLAPLSVGDARTNDATVLPAMFEEHFDRFILEEHALVLDGTADQVRAALLGFYNLDRISPEGKADIRATLESAILDNTTESGTVPLSLPIRHFTAIKR